MVERELGVGPEVCALVGDHPVNDVAGAHGAGWRSVWLGSRQQGAVPRRRAAARCSGELAVSRLPGLLPRLATKALMGSVGLQKGYQVAVVNVSSPASQTL